MIRLYLLAGACLLAMGAAADRFTPVIGANARIHDFKAEAAGWQKNAAGWKAYGEAEKRAFAQSDALRLRENDRAVAALSEASTACSIRIARARSSALAIATIVNKEPKINANGCPVRELIDPDVLRHALSPRARP